MVERVLSMHEAQGSIPCSSTFFGFFFCHPASCVLPLVARSTKPRAQKTRDRPGDLEVG
jgi:hypothetical protein